MSVELGTEILAAEFWGLDRLLQRHAEHAAVQIDCSGAAERDAGGVFDGDGDASHVVAVQ